MNKTFCISVVFAVCGLVMAWLSLSLSCAHVGVENMCEQLSEAMLAIELESVSLNRCFMQADLSKNLCSRISTVSWFGVFFGISAFCFGAKQAIEAYVNHTWENENI